MVLDELKEIEYYAASLAKGIDPTSKTKFDGDTILSLPEIVEYNKKVCELIDIVRYGNRNKQKAFLIPFRLTDSEKQRFHFSNDEISISHFCTMINNDCHSLKGMDKIKINLIGILIINFVVILYTVLELKVGIPSI